MVLKICVFLLPFLSGIYAQTYSYVFSIGDFKDASSFHISPAGFIYVTDKGTNEIIKIDTMGNRLENNGGFGWEEGNFDEPRGVYTTPLNVYVCDKNNHRVQFFDKNLNYLSQISTRENEDTEIQFGYPVSTTLNKQGDLFILDTENKRVLKLDLFGNFLQNFAGYNYGKYSLSSPVKLAAGPDNNIFVAEKDRILIYDPYGNGIGEITGLTDISDINIIFNNMTITADGKIFYSLAGKGEQLYREIELIGYESGNKILSSLIFNNKLYLLTSKEIHVFKGTNN